MDFETQLILRLVAKNINGLSVDLSIALAIPFADANRGFVSSLGELIENEQLDKKYFLLILKILFCIKNNKELRIYFPPLINFSSAEEFFYRDIPLDSLAPAEIDTAKNELETLKLILDNPESQKEALSTFKNKFEYSLNRYIHLFYNGNSFKEKNEMHILKSKLYRMVLNTHLQEKEEAKQIVILNKLVNKETPEITKKLNKLNSELESFKKSFLLYHLARSMCHYPNEHKLFHIAIFIGMGAHVLNLIFEVLNSPVGASQFGIGCTTNPHHYHAFICNVSASCSNTSEHAMLNITEAQLALACALPICMNQASSTPSSWILPFSNIWNNSLMEACCIAGKADLYWIAIFVPVILVSVLLFVLYFSKMFPVSSIPVETTEQYQKALEPPQSNDQNALLRKQREKAEGLLFYKQSALVFDFFKKVDKTKIKVVTEENNNPEAEALLGDYQSM